MWVLNFGLFSFALLLEFFSVGSQQWSRVDSVGLWEWGGVKGGPTAGSVDLSKAAFSPLLSSSPLQFAPVLSNPTFCDCCLVWTIFLGVRPSAAQGSLQLLLRLVLTPPPPHQTFLSI